MWPCPVMHCLNSCLQALWVMTLVYGEVLVFYIAFANCQFPGPSSRDPSLADGEVSVKSGCIHSSALLIGLPPIDSARRADC